MAREEAKVVEECLKCARWEKARMALADTFYVLGGSELVGYAVESEESH